MISLNTIKTIFSIVDSDELNIKNISDIHKKISNAKENGLYKIEGLFKLSRLDIEYFESKKYKFDKIKTFVPYGRNIPPPMFLCGYSDVVISWK